MLEPKNPFTPTVLSLCAGPSIESGEPDGNLPPPRALAERDPSGLSADTPGAKLDAGKVRPALVLGGFARALLEVSKVGTYGALKYTDNGWQEVPNGVNRYDDAGLRHWLYEKCGIPCDSDTALLHAAHEAWNSLARLDLLLREKQRAAAT